MKPLEKTAAAKAFPAMTTRISGARLGLGEKWTCWHDLADGGDIGLSFGREGMIEVQRNKLGTVATIRFVALGRYHYWHIQPAPSRAALVRRARRLLRQAEGERPL